MNCILCEISSRHAPASFVYDGGEVFAIMSLDQPNPYKVLVIPRVHIETVYDLTDDLAGAIFQTTVRVARAIRDASGCDGLNLVQSNGRAGQQEVLHFHLHLVPRFWGDEIRFAWNHARAERSALEVMAEKIRSKM